MTILTVSIYWTLAVLLPTLPSALCELTRLMLTTTLGSYVFIVPILQMWKPRPRLVKSLAQERTLIIGRSSIQTWINHGLGHDQYL